MIYLATATITPLLERTLTYALARTVPPDMYRLIVVRGAGSHGWKLDAALNWLPADALWFGTLDDDVAPLASGWLHHLLRQIGERQWGSMDVTLLGTPHPVCALYRVAWLRAMGATFRPFVDVAGVHHDVGAGFGLTEPSYLAPPMARSALPVWLRHVGGPVMAGADGRPAVAHLGGGTIGNTSWRMPTWLWALCVRSHLGALPAQLPTRIIVDSPGSVRPRTARARLRAAVGR